MWHQILHILQHAAIDTLYVLPFLLAIHILMEIIESQKTVKTKVNKLLNGKAAPIVASGVGIVPQCGFSVVATKLFSSKNIKMGTLLAVYIATSDEAIPIILATPGAAIKLVPLLLIKFFLAIAVGYGINFVSRKTETVILSDAKAAEAAESCGCGHHHGENENIENCDCDCHKDDATTDSLNADSISADNANTVGTSATTADITAAKQTKKFDAKKYILHPLKHTLEVLLYIFIVNLILGSIIEFVGEDRLYAALDNARWAQPFIAALIGLIPNCASSVVISEMYAMGGITLGAAIAGLTCNAGIGLAVLFKENRKNLKQNLIVTGLLFLIAITVGIIITAIGF